MAIEHILTDFDTIHNLAARYGVSWQDIVDYNGLEYPYILDSKEAYEKLFASGYVRVTRDHYQSALTIYKGSQFSTKVDNHGIRKTYEAVEDTIIPAGQQTGYIYVRCINYGTFGNTIAHSIVEPYRVLTNLGLYTQLTVTNEEPFLNGTDAKVKFTGQSIFIPVETDVQITANTEDFLEALGGEDLYLTEDGDLTDDGSGDLASVSGLQNIVQAIKNRFMEEVGAFPHHPEYPPGIHERIGRPMTPYVERLIEIDIHSSLAYEDRIDSVEVRSIVIEGTTIYLDLDLHIGGTVENVRLTLDYSRYFTAA